MVNDVFESLDDETFDEISERSEDDVAFSSFDEDFLKVLERSNGLDGFTINSGDQNVRNGKRPRFSNEDIPWVPKKMRTQAVFEDEENEDEDEDRDIVIRLIVDSTDCPANLAASLPELGSFSTVTDSPVSETDTIEAASVADIKQEIMDELPADEQSDDFSSLSPTDCLAHLNDTKNKIDKAASEMTTLHSEIETILAALTRLPGLQARLDAVTMEKLQYEETREKLFEALKNVFYP